MQSHHALTDKKCIKTIAMCEFPFSPIVFMRESSRSITTMSKLALLLLFVLFVSSTLTSADERQCVDGMSYFDGCNQCYCMGGHVACTLMACHTFNTITGENGPVKVIPPPGDFWVPLTP